MAAGTYQHGVYSSTIPTAVVPPDLADASSLTAVGIAPLNQLNVPYSSSGYAPYVNIPVLCESYSDFATNFGVTSENFDTYGLAGAAYTMFQLYNTGPFIGIAVGDPSAPGNYIVREPSTITFANAFAEIADTIILPTLVLTSGDNTLVLGTDYVVTFSIDNNFTSIQLLPSSNYFDATSLTCQYNAYNPANITNEDIAGGVDENGNKTGIAVIDAVFPVTGVVPLVCAAVNFADDPTVYAIGQAKMQSISGQFRGFWLGQISGSEVTTYTGVNSWKNSQNFVSEYSAAVWPNASLGGVWNLGINHLAGIYAQATATDGQGVPYFSPSNFSCQCDSTVAGTNGSVNVVLGPEEANYLNGIGIWTMQNYQGWIGWGNNSAAYPATTDPAWRWISVNIMFAWISNTLGLSLRQFVDRPGSLRNLTTVTATIKQFLNGLVAQGALDTAAVTFPPGTNSVVTVENGVYTWQLSITPPPPMEVINCQLQFDSVSLAAWITAVSAQLLNS
jgi:uncharacterized protein